MELFRRWQQVNANMKADTTDALLERKKQMHMATFNYSINEIANLLQAQSKLEHTSVCR